MWKKVLVVGGVAAAIVGAGTTALAMTGGTVPTTKPSDSSAAHHRDPLASALHATWVTHAKTGYVTHDAIRGTVTAVSPTAVTVTSPDGVSRTYAVGTATVVHTRAEGTAAGSTGQIAKVAAGDTVGVFGTGTTSLTATHVLDRTR